MIPQNRYSLKDVENRNDHAELIAGNLVIQDKTTVSHNLAIAAISTALREYISDNNGDCLVFTENVALYCDELSDDKDNYFLPDVMVVCDKNGIKENGVHTAPLFVAEVTSDATKRNDYTDKMIIYRNIGVKEYWVVDLQKKSVVKYLADSEFVPEPFLHPEVMKVSVYKGLNIDLSEYMKN